MSNFKPLDCQLQVRHVPQVPMHPFRIHVLDEYDAYLTVYRIAIQHLWLFKNRIIPDYANSINVVYYDVDDGDWFDYENIESELYGWSDFEQLLPKLAEGGDQKAKQCLDVVNKLQELNPNLP